MTNGTQSLKLKHTFGIKANKIQGSTWNKRAFLHEGAIEGSIKNSQILFMTFPRYSKHTEKYFVVKRQLDGPLRIAFFSQNSVRKMLILPESRGILFIEWYFIEVSLGKKIE